MNITQSFLDHKGYNCKNANEGIIMPYILADSFYCAYEDYVKPLKLKHDLKMHAKQMIACYREFNKQFFAAFDDEEKDYIVDKMDAYQQGLANNIEMLRLSVMKNLMEFPSEVRTAVAGLTVCVHLAQSTRILYENIYKLKDYRGEERPMHNKHLAGMVSYSGNLFKSYTRRFCPCSHIINLNDVEEIKQTSTALCNKILEILHKEQNETNP